MDTQNTTLSGEIPVGCGCAACQSGQTSQNVPSVDNNEGGATSFYTDGTDDETTISSGDGDDGAVGSNGQPVATMEEIANYLKDGFWSDVNSVSRQFSGTVSYGISNNYSAAEKTNIRLAFDLWSDIADVTFTETTYGNGNIDLTTTANGQAYSQVQSWYNSGEGHYITTKNFITIDTTQTNWWDNIDTIGANGFRTAMHEIGHALGLGHAGNYNAGQGSPTYQNSAQWANDTRQYTIMSYWDANNYNSTDHWNEFGQWQYASTPMVADMLAIQSIYGADMTTRTGNTTYGFNTTADVSGRVMYDFSVTTGPVVTLWDAGGVDTLDVSGYTATYHQVIDLRDGNYSSVGAMTNNVGIAVGATIENAVGGKGNDTITGNDADNDLQGGLGNDTFNASSGDDAIDGEGGSDTWSFTDAFSAFVGNILSATSLTLQHIANGWTDTISNVENFIFNGVSYTFEQLESLFQPENIAVTTFWDGGSYQMNSSAIESTDINGSAIGYGGQTVMTVDRSAGTEMTVTLTTAAPGALRINSAGLDETISIEGTHNGLSTWVYGGDGNDTVTMVETIIGTARLYGEAGDDELTSGIGNDYIYGGTGDDTINTGSGNDRAYGGDDDDTIDGGAGHDTLDGDDGNDTVSGGEGTDRVYGGNGDDILNGGSGIDRLYGEADNDTLNGGDHQDYLYGGAGTDTLNGDDGDDLLYGASGEDILNGGEGNDKLWGEDDNDTLNGGAGVDRLYGADGDDILNGGDDADFLYGGNDSDILNGDASGDTLYGQNGADRLNGGAGNDNLYGGNGTDTLVGGDGADTLRGEASADIFGFTSLDAADLIVDFTLSGPTKDSLNITDILSGYDSETDDINDFATLVYQHANRTDLYINQDGIGADWTMAAVIQGSDLAGVDIDFLGLTGQLITDTTLL